MKTEDILHWQIYICSCPCERHYYSFICQHQFENFVFVMSVRTDTQYYLSSFFYSPTWLLENSFIFCWLSMVPPVRKHISPLPAWLVGKIASHLPAWPITKSNSHLPIWVWALGQAQACADLCPLPLHFFPPSNCFLMSIPKFCRFSAK